MQDRATARGQLFGDFAFFHLSDQKTGELQYHYHDFDKLVVFISGKATYVIEGRHYILRPMDVLFVGRHAIHRPLIDNSVPYERFVIWINPDFLDRHADGSENPGTVFRQAAITHRYRLRLSLQHRQMLSQYLSGLESAITETQAFGAGILRNARLFDLLVWLTRQSLQASHSEDEDDNHTDPVIAGLLAYIATHLAEDLSVDHLSREAYLSRFHLMRRFREATGETLHAYIRKKRLMLAADLLRAGSSPGDCVSGTGFQDYSTFSRAFSAEFGTSPRLWQKRELSGTGLWPARLAADHENE